MGVASGAVLVFVRNGKGGVEGAWLAADGRGLGGGADKTGHAFSPPTPTGGFSDTYAALCDYNGLSCREEVQWVCGGN